MVYKKRSRRGGGFRRRTRTRRAPVRKKALRRVVKQVVKRQIETKLAVQTGGAVFNSAADSSGDCINLLPDIQPGLGNAHRVGVKISPQGLYVRGYFQSYWAPNDLPRSRIGVRMLVGMPTGFKEINSAINLNQDWLPEIIDMGNSTAGLDGTIQHTWMGKVNKRRFTPYVDKKFVLTQPYVTNTGGPVPDAQQMSGVAIDLSKTTKFFNFKIPFKGTWEYAQEDNGPVSTSAVAQVGAPSQGIQFPLKGGAIMLVSYCFLDNSPASVLPAIQGNFQANLYYKDA